MAIVSLSIRILLSEPQKLSVGNGHLLRIIETFFDVHIELSGDEAVITGEESKVHSANDVVTALDRAILDGEEPDEQSVSYLSRLRLEGRLETFLQSGKEPILVTPHGKAIRAKTLGQQVYIDAQKHNEVVLCIGPAGTGKTYLGVAMAVAAFKKREVSRIILARPAVEAGERLGFLPGDIKEKVDPYMRPIYDALFDLLGEEAFERYSEKGMIEVSPLAFMRGRTLDDAFIVLDEAQNTSVEQMKMFLTRIGMNARACVLGDITQIDLPRGMRNGLSDAAELLTDVAGLSVVTLNDADIVRNPLVQRILKAYNNRMERGHEEI